MKDLNGWLAEIQQSHPKAWDLGLERVGEVGRRLGVLKPAPICFLVAGTNGKGSTCEYLAQLCVANGKSYGKTTSPFLHKYNEQIVIDGVACTDELIVQAFTAIQKAAADISLSYFEYGALAAMLLFQQAKVDVAILEIGLGGRLDAMNIVEPDVSIITRIALDHQDWLGDTRELIGFEKAGVMRSTRPVVVLDDDPPESLLNHADAIDADLALVGRDFKVTDKSLTIGDSRFELGPTRLPRASAVAAIVASIKAGFLLDQEQVDQAISRASLPGRLQIIEREPLVVLDVCHNPDAANYLRQRLDELEVSKWHMVAGLYQDKDHAGVFQHLAPISSAWYLCDLDSPRGAASGDLQHVLSEACGLSASTYGKVSTALEAAKQAVQPGEGVVVLGSFSTVAAALSGT